MGSRRQCALVLAAFAALLLVSVPFMHFEAARYTQPLQDLFSQTPAPDENHFPGMDQRILHGSSNVWEDAEHITESHWREDQALENAARSVLVVLKTGAETMWSRVPVHFDTTLRRFENHIIVSDMGALMHGELIWDVLQFLPAWALNSAPLLGYRVRRTGVDEHWGWGPTKLQIDGEGAGWQTDRYKNIPAFVLAWQMTDATMPWYLMIDGDTYIASSTIAAAIEGKDPDAVWYFGHGVGANPIFAHGGSGILLSRGAMRAMFREPSDVDWHHDIIEDACQRAIPDCCGDSIVAYEFERLTNMPAETYLELEENGMFQGQPKAAMRLNPKMWCTPVGSFHHVSAAEIQELFQWEGLARARKAARGDHGPLTYADFYEDFVEPFIVEQRSNWYFEEGNMPLLAAEYKPESPGDVWDGGRQLDLLGEMADCRRACELDETCLAWEWRRALKCRIFLGEFTLGMALNPYSPKWQAGTTDVAAGHMVERIDAVHRSAPCRASNATAPAAADNDVLEGPGWYNSMMHKNVPNGNIVHELASRPLLREFDAEEASEFNLTFTPAR